MIVSSQAYALPAHCLLGGTVGRWRSPAWAIFHQKRSLGLCNWVPTRRTFRFLSDSVDISLLFPLPLGLFSRVRLSVSLLLLPSLRRSPSSLNNPLTCSSRSLYSLPRLCTFLLPRRTPCRTEDRTVPPRRRSARPQLVRRSHNIMRSPPQLVVLGTQPEQTLEIGGRRHAPAVVVGAVDEDLALALA